MPIALNPFVISILGLVLLSLSFWPILSVLTGGELKGDMTATARLLFCPAFFFLGLGMSNLAVATRFFPNAFENLNKISHKKR